MNCIDDEIIQQLLDGELSEAQKQTIMRHIKTCDACKASLREAIELHRSLDAVISQIPCPSEQMLEAFAAKTLDALGQSQISQHIVLCPRCDYYVRLCQMSAEEVLAAEEKEKAFFRIALAEDQARSVAKATIEKLMPKEVANTIFSGLWDCAVDAFEKMCDKGLDKLPRLSGSGELAGALGFSGAVDPQWLASAIITLTTLATIHQAAMLNVSNNRDRIKGLASSFAEQLGAGKELKARILQTLPALVVSD
jgi:hypothetical protein